MLVEFWHDILCMEEQKDYQDAMLKKYFGKNRRGRLDENKILQTR